MGKVFLPFPEKRRRKRIRSEGVDEEGRTTISLMAFFLIIFVFVPYFIFVWERGPASLLMLHVFRNKRGKTAGGWK